MGKYQFCTEVSLEHLEICQYTVCDEQALKQRCIKNVVFKIIKINRGCYCFVHTQSRKASTGSHTIFDWAAGWT